MTTGLKWLLCELALQTGCVQLKVQQCPSLQLEASKSSSSDGHGPGEDTGAMGGLEHLKDRLRDLGSFSLEKAQGRFQRGLPLHKGSL